MTEPRLLIIGGGLAGMSAGCHALESGFKVTIVEHNLALGGVCTAWQRGPYVIDGCIHWLTGGAFSRLYAELGIFDNVPVRVLERWFYYEDGKTGLRVGIDRNLDATFAALCDAAPEDSAELERLRRAAADLGALEPPLHAPELMTLRDGMRMAWDMRDKLGSLVHLRKSVGEWVEENIQSPALARLFLRMLPPEAPALFLAMTLGYLERGQLSRPVGGTAAFRAALEKRYRLLGGHALLHSTVDEILVESGGATGVRLADGTMLEADAVISTASSPETVLRLLGGRYDAAATRERLAKWKLFDPITLVSYGVEQPYADKPSLWLLNGITPFEAAGRTHESLYLRVCNDDASFAPPGHSVVQAMLPTDYVHWATLGSKYTHEKDAVASTLLQVLAPFFPGIEDAVRVIDVATPLSYWSLARSWRGAYEGWMPTTDSFFSHVEKKLHGLSRFYLAGQWVEPGGGVPMAVMSGRQAAELLCAEFALPFRGRASA
jgi:phytoene dehydrogenase-like protein